MENRKPFSLNKAQMRFVLQKPSEAISIWSRGTGKSFLIAWLIHIIVKNMPRSCWAIVGKSYKQILTRTLPSTLFALENFFGYRRDVDFFIKRKPAANMGFDKPFQAPEEYDHFIIFKNGTGFHLVSLDGGGGSIRGLNIDGYIADEGLEINKEKLDKQVSSTNRGNLRYFSHIPFHHGKFIFSSMPYGSDGKWLLEQANYYKEDGYNFKAIREEVVKLQLQFIDNKDIEYRVEIWNKIVELKKRLRFYPDQNGLLYSEADIFDNLANVGVKFLEQQRRDLTDFIFLVEILNWFPDSIENGYYPSLDRTIHGYSSKFDNGYLNSLNLDDEALKKPDSRMDADCIPNLPLRLAVDWGAKINCLTVTQYFSSINTLRFLKNIYVKHPKILDDLAKEFCEYYKHHPNRDVVFAYDHTGNTKQANSELTYAEQFAKILKANGWNVNMVTKGAAPTQMEKYLLWHKVLKNSIAAREGKEIDPALPLIEFNLDNCNETFVSMQNAQTKEDKGSIYKNKASERNPLLPQEEATHLSDTADIQLTSIANDPFLYMPGFIDVLRR
jgi:hypothetical protein